MFVFTYCFLGWPFFVPGDLLAIFFESGKAGGYSFVEGLVGSGGRVRFV